MKRDRVCKGKEGNWDGVGKKGEGIGKKLEIGNRRRRKLKERRNYVN